MRFRGKNAQSKLSGSSSSPGATGAIKKSSLITSWIKRSFHYCKQVTNEKACTFNLEVQEKSQLMDTGGEPPLSTT